MGYSNGVVSAPVGIYDVRRALGLSSNDLGTLCKSTRINMWSKFKPVRLNMIDTVTGQWDATNTTWYSDASWFRGNPNDNYAAYGWKPPVGGGSASALATLLSNYSYSSSVNANHYNGWVAELPQGSSGLYRSPYRLTDFAGYNHNANIPPEKLSCDTELIVYASGSARITPTYIQRATDDNPISQRDYVTPKDILQKVFGDLATVRTGFALVSQDYSSVRLLTTDTSMVIEPSDVGDSGSTSSRLVDGSSYWVCPFFTDTQQSGKNTSPASGANFSTFPLMTPVLMEVRKSSQVLPNVSASLTATLQWDAINMCYDLVCSFTLQDTDNSSFTLTRVTIEVCDSSNTTVLYRHNFGDVSMSSAHPTYTNSYTFTVYETNLRVRLVASGYILKTVVPLMPR